MTLDNEHETQHIENEPEEQTQILVVDDDLALRTLNARFFKMDENTNVLTAVDGQDGLETLEKLGGKLDLVFSDNTMPRMKGEDFLRQAKTLYPDIFAVLATGDFDLDEEKIDELLADGVNAVLKKPTEPEQLLEVLQKAREWKKERREGK